MKDRRIQKKVLIFSLCVLFTLSIFFVIPTIREPMDRVTNPETRISSLTAPSDIWNKTWTKYADSYGFKMSMDLSGNIYCIGQINISNNYEVLVVKYDADGKEIWNTSWGGMYRDYGYDIKVNQTNPNEIFCAGATGNGASYETALALIKMDGQGNEIWNSTWDNSTYDLGNALAFDLLGNIYVVGATWVDADGDYDLLLVKFNSTGHEVWNSTWGGSGGEQGNGIVVVGSTIYVVGYTSSYAAVGTDPDLALLEFDTTSGAKIWNETWGDAENDYGWDICMDSRGNITVAGRFNHTGVDSQVAIVKFNLTGGEIWNSTWNTPYSEEGRSLSLNAADEIYCGGYITYSGSNDDFLIIKFDALGNELWNTTWGNANHDRCYDVLIGDYSSGVYALGDYQPSAGDFDLALVRFMPNNQTFVIPANINVTLEIGNLKITVSANVSLTINTSLFVQLPSGLPDPTNGLYYLEIVVNATVYEINATIRFYYDENNLPAGITEEMLDIFFYNGINWESLGATVNTDENYIEVEINHFSFYAIVGKETSGGGTLPAPPIPSFEILFILISLISLISLVVLYRKLKNFNNINYSL